MNIRLTVAMATLSLTGALASAPAPAEADAARGEVLAYTCLGCHGIEGYRNAYPSYRVPKLGGQRAAYLAAALRGYRDGTREHPTMVAQAQSLDDDDIADIAAYLAALGADALQSLDGPAPDLSQAATCVACHGQNGIGVESTWPTLAGQHEDYLVAALNQYRDGTRTEPTMSQMAQSLSDDEVLLLARYYSQLEGLETTLPE